MIKLTVQLSAMDGDILDLIMMPAGFTTSRILLVTVRFLYTYIFP
jgi:hypothetical protein